MLTLVLSVASPAVAKGAADSVAATWRLVEHANFANVTYYIKDQKTIIYGAYGFESASSVFGTVDVSRKVADEPCLVDVTRVEPTRLTEDPSTCAEHLPGGGPISATYHFNGSGKLLKSIARGHRQPPEHGRRGDARGARLGSPADRREAHTTQARLTVTAWQERSWRGGDRASLRRASSKPSGRTVRRRLYSFVVILSAIWKES